MQLKPYEITESTNHPISLRIRVPLRLSLMRHLKRVKMKRSDFLRAAIVEKMRRDRLAKRS